MRIGNVSRNSYHEVQNQFLHGNTNNSSHLVKSLMKQKQALIEQKNELINTTRTKGGDMQSIRASVEAYDQQIQTIDRQISQEMSKQAEKQMENQKQKQDNQPKTSQEIENKRLADIVNLSSDLSQAKNVQSIQVSVKGDARVLKSEIELDKMRGGSSEAISRKEKKLAELEEKANELTSKLAEKAGETVEQVEEDNEEVRKRPIEEEKNTQITRLDRIV